MRTFFQALRKVLGKDGRVKDLLRAGSTDHFSSTLAGRPAKRQSRASQDEVFSALNQPDGGRGGAAGMAPNPAYAERI
jgi:hypothetical protein